MLRRTFQISTLAVICTTATVAQDPAGIQWSLRVEDSVARAKQTRKPLMFYVYEHNYCNVGELVLNQQKAFRDSMVRELAQRFVAVRLSSSRYRNELESWNVDPELGLEIIFVTPDGERIDVLSPNGVGEPSTLARKMALVFQHYRDVLFDKELRPVFEDKEASTERLLQMLACVREFLILSADRYVIGLFERETPAPNLIVQAYKTLAVLSTPAAVDFLLEEAVEVDAACEALKQCTPDAAERMLPKLESDNSYVQLAVYHALASICKIDRVKPDRFWQGKNRVVLNKEIKRVKEIVESKARRWRKRYAEYR